MLSFKALHRWACQESTCSLDISPHPIANSWRWRRWTSWKMDFHSAFDLKSQDFHCLFFQIHQSMRWILSRKDLMITKKIIAAKLKLTTIVGKPMLCLRTMDEMLKQTRQWQQPAIGRQRSPSSPVWAYPGNGNLAIWFDPEVLGGDQMVGPKKKKQRFQLPATMFFQNSYQIVDMFPINFSSNLLFFHLWFFTFSTSQQFVSLSAFRWDFTTNLALGSNSTYLEAIFCAKDHPTKHTLHTKLTYLTYYTVIHLWVKSSSRPFGIVPGGYLSVSR